MRNYIAQTAIEAAEAGDYSEVQRVLHLLQHPYADDVDLKSTPDATTATTAIAANAIATHDGLCFTFR